MGSRESGIGNRESGIGNREYSFFESNQVHRIFCLFPVPCSLFPVPCSLFPCYINKLLYTTRPLAEP
ncbi:MAG: hypothetical protein F6K55_33295 [Moorea sp. SIO4A3]|nr:hypothetical protein [Moorena sp. SIO4A3]